MSATDLKNESEAQLILKAQSGNREAYGELAVRLHAPVFASLYHFSANRDLAQDATQQAFIQAWLHLSSYHPRSSFRSWLTRIAVNACLDSMRRDKRIHPDAVTEATPDVTPDPEQSLILKQRTQFVQRALQSLNDTSRAVLVLREYGGLSYQEIASALEIPLGTVMSRLNTARTQLRIILQPLLAESEVEYG